MSRAIFVLSLPRSGSSAVAGALHRMGVDMGEGHLQVPDVSNSRGYYEDLRWQRLNKELAGHGYSSRRVSSLPDRHRQAYRALFEKCSAAPLWGVKAPRMAFVFQHLHVLCPCELRVVLVRRPIEDVYASIERHSEVAYGGSRRMSHLRATRLIDNWERAVLDARRSFAGPCLTLFYDQLVDAPAWTLSWLARFVFEGMPLPDLTEAIQWVDPAMRHQRSSCPRSPAVMEC